MVRFVRRTVDALSGGRRCLCLPERSLWSSVAFLYGWVSLLVTDPGITASVAVGLALRRISPTTLGVGAKRGGGGGNSGRCGSQYPWSIARCRRAATLAALKLGLLGFLVVWGFSLGRGNWMNLTPFWTQRAGSDPLLPALAVGLISAFFSFGGWWDLSKLAGEMRDPKRTLPRAMVLGVSLVTVIYIAISAVFLYLVPASRIASDEAFAALAGEALFGPLGGKLFTSIVIVSVTGSLMAMLMASPRVYYAMARDGLFFPAFAAVDPSRGTPARAVMLQAALAILLAVTGTFDEILTFLMVPTLLFLALTVWAVFVLRRGSSLRSPLEAPGFPVSPLVFVVPVLALVGMLIVRDPSRTSLGCWSSWRVCRSLGGWQGARALKPTADDSHALEHADASPPTSDDPSSVSAINTNS